MNKRDIEDKAVKLLIDALKRDTGSDYHVQRRPEDDPSVRENYDFDLTDGAKNVAVEIVSPRRRAPYGTRDAPMEEIHAQWQKFCDELKKTLVLSDVLPGQFLLHGDPPTTRPPKDHKVAPVVKEIRGKIGDMALYQNEPLSAVPLELMKLFDDGSDIILRLVDLNFLDYPLVIEDTMKLVLKKKDGQLSRAKNRRRILGVYNQNNEMDTLAFEEAVRDIFEDQPTALLHIDSVYFLAEGESWQVWSRGSQE